MNFVYNSNKELIFPEYDLTPFVEEEDFDWGLFLKNIVNDKARQKIIISTK